MGLYTEQIVAIAAFNGVFLLLVLLLLCMGKYLRDNYLKLQWTKNLKKQILKFLDIVTYQSYEQYHFLAMKMP